MKRLSIAVVVAAALSLAAGTTFAADKPDLDGLLKQVFHGKPGWWTTTAAWPAPPKGWKFAPGDFPLLWQHKAASK